MGAVTFSIDPELVACLRRSLPLTLFVETGTFHGDSVAANADLFDRLISIEVSDVLWRESARRFANMSHVEIVHGNSPDALATLRSRFARTPTLFWLDAHWCVAENTAGETSQCPLLDELRAIRSLHKDSVVLIDDARLFLAPPPEPHNVDQWPTFADLLAELGRLSSAHEMTVINDVIIFHPRAIRSAVEDYGRKYGVDWLRARQAQSEISRMLVEMEAKERVIEELHSSLIGTRSSHAVLEVAIEEKERVIHQLDDAHKEVLAREEGVLTDNQTKEAVISSLQAQSDALDAHVRELQQAIEDREQHLQSLQNELATHQERYLEAVGVMQAKEKVINELSGALASKDTRLNSVESTVAQHAVLIGDALRDNADALAQAESRQREMLVILQQANETLRALLLEKSNANEQFAKLINSSHTHASLLATLEGKERVIQELSNAIDAYRASYSLLGYLVSPVRKLKAMHKRAAAPLKRAMMPRLGNLNQHAPIDVKLPPHYGREMPPKNPPRISIVTPSFRQAAFIERTIKSVLDQAYPNLEYFVQDGGSDDGTCDVLRRYSEQLSGWDSHADGGQSHAINLGFAKTSGEIMAWLNSDDILYPGALAYVANYFARHPEVDVVYGHRLLIDENDRQIGRWIMPAHNDAVLSWADFIPQETLFWRRRIWENTGAHIDETFRFAMDWDLLMRFRDAGARFARLPRVIGGFRIHTQQKTSAVISDIGFKEMDRIRTRALGSLPKHTQISAAIAPYLFRHVAADWQWGLQGFFRR